MCAKAITGVRVCGSSCKRPGACRAGCMARPAVRDSIELSVALKRVGDTEAVCGAAVYFASVASSYTTGARLASDGGVKP
ncbi:MAG: SDR family oxidoreductase [Gammaproteobacteria bacterium]|nr:SDR family oxidoreductase [Gammaproteobacteria bacterium]MBT8151587.1 SDR family oxidoreductase [Gammaproteobacteria bacterium]NND39226.1 SDR family oxidoreductase [Pseudomonadales bacterium]NNM11600.1 SDR family oxidoreductase [Pseudomonadales bacterium]RZV50916.1 MAG: SDR family oxidoreductase [Pseudomonadales bacterium]